jgi:DHA2 family multidrug resistance protein
MVCLTIFTASSLLCGLAPSLTTIILCRVLQGAGGGGLQPMAQAILADTVPPRQRGLAFALFGVTTIIAPTIGPTLGGWITDNYSWRWIFFINLPVGLLALFLINRFVEDPPWIKRTSRGGVRVDYIDIALLVVGVGALQVLLDKGQEEDWFGSHLIVTLAFVAVIGLVALVVWEWRHPTPIVEVKLFKNLNFLGANLMMFALGIMLFSSLVMMPQFLQTLMGYTAQSAGLVLSGGGLLLLSLMPVIGVLSSKFQARYLIAFGWLTLSLAMFYSTQALDLQISFESASVLRVVQVAGLAFLFVPINLVSYVGMVPQKSSSIAGLVNFMRNMGASVGTSLVTTLIARRAQVRQVYLVAHTRVGQAAFAETVPQLSHRLAASGLETSRATAQAYARLYGTVIRQATMLAYIDTFGVLCAVAGLAFLLSFALRRNDPTAAGAARLE